MRKLTRSRKPIKSRRLRKRKSRKRKSRRSKIRRGGSRLPPPGCTPLDVSWHNWGKPVTLCQ